MPLLGRLEDDLLVPGSNDKDLRVTELGDVQDGMGGAMGICAQQGGACGGGPVPWVGLGSRLLRLLEGLLQIGNGVGLVLRVIAGVLGLSGPEVEDESRPEATGWSAGGGKQGAKGVTYAACPFSLVAQAPTPSLVPMK